MARFFLLWMILIMPFLGMGQRKSAAPQKKEIKNSASWGVGINTNTNSGLLGGFSFVYNLPNRSFVNIDLTNTKDYQEFDSPYSFNGRTYVEGKLNYLINLRPSYGKHYLLLNQAQEGGTSLSGRISTGPTLGLLKPYYVDLSYTDAGKTITTSVPMVDALNNTYNKSSINGEGSFFTGFSQSKLVPGWHVKTALEFKFETLKQNYLAVETGFILDFFSQPVEILNQTNPRSVYTTGYVTFFFGKSK
ncbi:MAG: hypothetical protein RLZZ96_1893 [Bacteroidota bacterium]|jgi:hypothetical protein